MREDGGRCPSALPCHGSARQLGNVSTPRSPLSLVDWRRRVIDLYENVRRASPEGRRRAWLGFRAARDRLFRSHPDSSLEGPQRSTFHRLDYYPYQSHWRVVGRLSPKVRRHTFETRLRGDGVVRFTRVARVRFVSPFGRSVLSLYWVEGYGGGLFLPFRDRTSGTETYGGGRYLFDTIKGANLGVTDREIVLDFNYAYNPSCAYSNHWMCPLAPAENRLPFAVEAGEKTYS